MGHPYDLGCPFRAFILGPAGLRTSSCNVPSCGCIETSDSRSIVDCLGQGTCHLTLKSVLPQMAEKFGSSTLRAM